MLSDSSRFANSPSTIAVTLASMVLSASAQTVTERPPVFQRLSNGSVKLSISQPVVGRQYGFQYSIDLKNWTLLPLGPLAIGTPNTAISYETSFSGIPRIYFRTIYSDDFDADFDGDGTPNLQEQSIGTNAYTAEPDSDGDGFTNALEISAGMNPNAPNDPSPAKFEFASQITRHGQLSPQGWETTNANDPEEIRTFRGVYLSATQNKTSSESGKEFNISANVTIDRILLPIVSRYENRIPIYRESVTHNRTTGRAFTTKANEQIVSSWAASSPGAIASRTKWDGTNPVIYGYTWRYAPPKVNEALSGEHLLAATDSEVYVPQSVEGTMRTWNTSSTPQDKTTSTVIDLPNRDTSQQRALPAGLNWTAPTTLVVSKPAEGITHLWQLNNRWTYGDLKNELDTRFQDPAFVDVGEGASAFLEQEPNGAVALQTYTLRIRKVPGSGYGPATLVWKETFRPYDDPATEASEHSLPESRLRVLRLGTEQANVPAASTTDYVLDPRVSNFTQLPGEAPIGSPRHGTTDIASPVEIGIAPDTGMVGEIGDLVPSAKKGSVVTHFVTPKKSPSVTVPAALSAEYVDLIATGAGVDATTFPALLRWESTEGGIHAGASANKIRVRRTEPGRTIIQLKTKDSGQVVAEMHVWVVWCEGRAIEGYTYRSDTKVILPNPNSQPVGTWVRPKSTQVSFEFLVRPEAIYSALEIPDLKGARQNPPPGGAEGADFRWDVSRRVRYKHVNPAPLTTITRNQIWGSPDLELALNSKAGFFPTASIELLSFPTDPAEGNDDPSTAFENNYPYIISPSTPSQIPPGTLTSLDQVTSPHILQSAGLANETVVAKVHFGEFVRLEIGIGSAAAKWYRVSDFVNWRVEKRFRKTGNVIIDDGSAIYYDNANY